MEMVPSAQFSINKPLIVKRTVDDLHSFFEEKFSTLSIEERQDAMNVLTSQLEEIETLCQTHMNDDRLILFEQHLVRLRKLYTKYQQISMNSNMSNTIGTLGANASVVSSVNSSHLSAGSSHYTGSSQLNANYPPPVPGYDNNTHYNTHVIGSKKVSNFSTNSSAIITSFPHHKNNSMNLNASQDRHSTSYNSQSRNRKPKRDTFTVQGREFEPSELDGFYTIDDSFNNDSIDGGKQNQKYIDVQIVLTLDELTTLAARKKGVKPENKLDKNAVAAQSMITRTPYIDPPMVQRAMYRTSGRL